MARFENPRISASRDCIGDIEMLWRSALSSTFHGPLCNCFRGAFPVIDAKTLEADVLDYLLPCYTHDPVPFLVDLLKTRQASPEGSFVDWLSSLRKAEITECSYRRLTEDIRDILSSICSLRPGFACI
jgi:hypothetical protein